jgi:hypothetical protein
LVYYKLYGLKNASLVVVDDEEAVHSMYVLFRSVRWSVAKSLA